jgi:hypothetical protein
VPPRRVGGRLRSLNGHDYRFLQVSSRYLLVDEKSTQWYVFLGVFHLRDTENTEEAQRKIQNRTLVKRFTGISLFELTKPHAALHQIRHHHISSGPAEKFSRLHLAAPGHCKVLVCGGDAVHFRQP